MKFKLSFFLVIILITSSAAFSSGALRLLLPSLSSISSSMKEGELAYDDVNKVVVYKNNNSITSLLPNSDHSKHDLFPKIESTMYQYFSTGSAIAYSYIHPGTIRIGNKELVNSNVTKCFWNEHESEVGWGHHDGSVNTVTVPADFRKPLYLYLSENGTGFRCIFSHNSTGPSSPYGSSRWILASSLAGQGGTYRTVNNFTTTNALTIAFPVFVPTAKSVKVKVNHKGRSFIGTRRSRALPHALLPTMKYIRIGYYRCNADDAFMIEETANMINGIGEEMIGYIGVSGCYDDDFAADPFDYYFNDGIIHGWGNANGTVYLPIVGWQELQPTSI